MGYENRDGMKEEKEAKAVHVSLCILLIAYLIGVIVLFAAVMSGWDGLG